jgi:SAM-dependent methyltransferase
MVSEICWDQIGDPSVCAKGGKNIKSWMWNFQYAHDAIISYKLVLPFEMYQEGFQDIVSIDFSRNAISEMNKKSGDKPGMLFMEMDVMEMSFPSGTFDVVIDKATLDSMLCGEGAIKTIQTMLQQIYRVLKPNGTFMMLSYAKSQLRLNFLKKKDFIWDISVETCRK